MEAGTLTSRTSQNDGAKSNDVAHGLRRYVTETKASIKTSEFWLTLAVIAGILIAASATDGAEGFGANQAWLYVAIVTGAYAVGRGLAKAGSGEPYSADAEGKDLGNSGR
jgi:hypothetical protein